MGWPTQKQFGGVSVKRHTSYLPIRQNLLAVLSSQSEKSVPCRNSSC